MNWTKKQFSIAGIVAVTSFMGTFLISSVNIALPDIERTFEMNAVSLSWVVTSFLLATAMFLLPIGRLGDLSGIKRLFKLGVIIFTLASFAGGLAATGWMLIGLRFIQGVGAALTSATGPAILVSAFSPQNRGRVLGISVSAVYMGLAVGPFAGGILTHHLGWRSIFLIASVLGVITTIIAMVFLGKDDKTTFPLQKLKLKGTFFYMVGLLAVVSGSSIIPSPAGWMLMAAGTAAVVIFWISENKSEFPVIDTKLFVQNRLFAYSNLAALINYSATFAIVFLLSLYLQKVQGLSPQEAGFILIAQPVMMAIFSPIAGRLSDRIDPRYLATSGMSMCTIGLFALAWLGETTQPGIIIAILIWVGLGFALFSSPNMNTIMSSVSKNQLGLASGFAATMRVVGQITSMTIATLFFAGIIGSQTIASVDTPLFLRVIRWGFLTFAAISLAGIYFSGNRGKVNRSA